jgi:serine/threonine protein kinase
MARYKRDDEVVDAQYRLTELLGQGPKSETWVAVGPDGGPVVLKVIDLGHRSGDAEFEVLSQVRRCQHPNVLAVTGLWLCDSGGNIVRSDSDAEGEPDGRTLAPPVSGATTELVVAQPLGEQNLARCAEAARAAGGLPLGELLWYVEGVARGVDYLSRQSAPMHKGGAAHGNLKPENVILIGGEAKVADYGFPKKSLGGPPTDDAAPELRAGKPVPQSDQYALAMMFVHLRTGWLPSERDSGRADQDGLPDLSALTPGERAVVQRATSAAPGDRYPTALDMAQALARACNVTPRRANASPLPSSTPPDAGASPVRFWLVGAFVLLALVAAIACYVIWVGM